MVVSCACVIQIASVESVGGKIHFSTVRFPDVLTDSYAQTANVQTKGKVRWSRITEIPFPSLV